MSRGIIIVLALIVILGVCGMYFLQHGQSLLLKPPSQERIAYINDQNGKIDLFTMNMDGSDKTHVTDDAASDRSPAWSADGLQLASVSDRKGSIYQLVVSAWNGRFSRILTASAGTKDFPVWSPGGTEIMYVSNGKIFYISPDGGEEEQRLPPHEADRGMGEMGNTPFVWAGFSSDRNYLLCLGDSDFGRAAFVLETPKGELPDAQDFKPIPVAMGRELDAAWSPQGQLIASAFIDNDGSNGLETLDISTMERRMLVPSTGDTTGTAKPAWSPDGTKIAYEAWAVKDGSPDKCKGIFVVDSTGGTPKQIVSGDAHEPCWSSDGQYIVYTLTGKDGKRDIWRVNADGSGAMNLTQGTGDNYSPVCSPKHDKKA